MAKKPFIPADQVSDEASLEILTRAQNNHINTCYSRMDDQRNQCKFGKSGICCKICHMGPCKITKNAPRGVCGADADTIVARNYLREVVGGTSAHSDHGRHLVLKLRKVALRKGNGYEIKDEAALCSAAKLYGIETFDRPKEDIALDLANLFIDEFTSQEETLKTLTLAPLKQQSSWDKHHISPLGIDRMVVESMHRTTMGVDHEYQNLVLQAFRTSLADGWGGSRIAMIVSDILFGAPQPVLGTSNLGILGESTINIMVHGHEPELSEMLTVAVQSPDIIKEAKATGAEGITLAGICCTANEMLMRHGIAIAGSFLQQELAIITGAVEMMIIDVQCCMPSLPDVASGYHTEIVSTTDIAKTAGANHLSFNHDDGLESAKQMVRRAIDNYKNRDPEKVFIPEAKKQLVGGFGVTAIKKMLGGTFRGSFRPLNDAIISGRIKGVVGIVGCNNPKTKTDAYMNILTKELVKENVLILKTGCAAIASAKQGMMLPEAALEYAGEGLKEVCETVGMPPVLHMGSCVDNARILEAATEIVIEGGLGDDISQLPAVGVAPEWMSEKAVAIGTYFVASGIDVVLGQPFYISGSENVTALLNKNTKALFNASFHDCEDPYEAANLILGILDDARKNLGIDKKKERKLFDMKDRREINV